MSIRGAARGSIEYLRSPDSEVVLEIVGSLERSAQQN
jgi:hypothetical protein